LDCCQTWYRIPGINLYSVDKRTYERVADRRGRSGCLIAAHSLGIARPIKNGVSGGHNIRPRRSRYHLRSSSIMIALFRKLLRPLFQWAPSLRTFTLDLVDLAARPLLIPFRLPPAHRKHADLIEAETERFNDAAEHRWATDTDLQHAMNKPFSEPESLARRFIDVGTLIDGLRLQPGDTVLEVGAGSCWFSHFLNRYGCKTLAVDVSWTALSVGRRLFEREPTTNWDLDPKFAEYDGHTLPVPDGSVDRIVLYDAFHHIPNQTRLLREMRRVLRPGGIAAMSEPGRGHAVSAATLAEAATGVLENELALEDIANAALEAGFEAVRVIIASDLPLMEVDGARLRAFMGGEGFARYWKNLCAALDGHHYMLLFTESAEPTTRRPRRLSTNIRRLRDTHSIRVSRGQSVTVGFDIYNRGDTRWLHSENEPGWTRFGAHLYRDDRERTLVDFDWFRVALPEDVEPERSVRVVADLPPVTDPGRYLVAFDLVIEGVAWFADRGSVPLIVPYDVG